MLQDIIIRPIKKDEVSVKPFLRWAGGKQSIIKAIFDRINIENVETYFEPFLGGASFFLNGNFKYSFLSDLNPNLINCYIQIKNNPQEIYNKLKSFSIPVDPLQYYKIREDFNNSVGQQTIEQAIRFIFLNKTSFNGIYRVNNKGIYNVPFGKGNPSFPDLVQLLAISEKLRNAHLFSGYYDEIDEMVKANDLIYLDPPYPRLSETSYFNHYTLNKFDTLEQIKLAGFAHRMKKKNCKVVISNADLPLIHSLYTDWNISYLDVTRFISCKKERFKVKELVIKNF